MASRKSFLSRTSHIFPTTSESETHLNQEGELELDEADVWNLSNTVTLTTEAKKGSRSALKRGSSSRVNPVSSSSVPMNVPDWSKILKEDYKKRSKESSDHNYKDDDESEGDQEDGGVRIPPHEYLARTRGASLSVHEGIGRTLKGRDLRSVRNAIWKKVGFED